MIRIALVLLAFLALPAGAEALQVPLASDLTIELDVPEGWEFSQEPPTFLLEQTAEHIRHELQAQGREVSDQKAREFARKRLTANEAFVFDADSGAHLLLDFSPLREGEKAPSDEVLSRSARLAGEGLTQEEGLDQVEFHTGEVSVSGAETAYRLDARFRMHGEPRKFIGIVGFVHPYWFYFYYTDPLKNPSNFGQMEKILRSVTVKSGR